jgi:hypothetical protein
MPVSAPVAIVGEYFEAQVPISESSRIFRLFQ